MTEFTLKKRIEGDIVIIETDGYLNNVGGEKISEECYKEIENGKKLFLLIRGVKIIVDGIPETTPDGQGQVDNIPLGLLSRLEVLRGPSASLYGNAAGGVLYLKTLDSLQGNKIKFRATFEDPQSLSTTCL